MRLSSRFVLTTTAIVALGLGVYWFTQNSVSSLAATADSALSGSSAGHPSNSTSASSKPSDAGEVSPETSALVRQREVLLAEARATISDPLVLRDREAEIHYLTTGVGTTPPIKNLSNPQVKSMAKAIESGHNPERISPLLPPAPFDAAAYQSDPQAYLKVVEPGRVFQFAEPADNVPVMDPVSPYWQEVPQGGSIELSVRAAPGWPVTFTSFDCGAFENELTSITVQADGSGLATVKFLGRPGTFNDSNILASSPMASGQARFIAHTYIASK